MQKNSLKKNGWKVFRSGALLALFALTGVSLLALVNQQTRDKIAENEYQALVALLEEIIPPQDYDNDLINDYITLPASVLQSDSAVTVYRARKQHENVLAIFVVSTSRGYAGIIKMIIGVKTDKTLSGVRVVSHSETPGLGDKMETRKSDWIKTFTGLSLQQPGVSQWAVKKDNGYFDQFTGATITPRAIVNTVKHTLLWAQKPQHLNDVFSQPTPSQSEKIAK